MYEEAVYEGVVYEGTVYEGKVYENNTYERDVYEKDVYLNEDVDKKEAYSGDLNSNTVTRKSKTPYKNLSKNIHGTSARISPGPC